MTALIDHSTICLEICIYHCPYLQTGQCIHCRGMYSVVAVVEHERKNVFWKRMGREFYG